MHVALVTRLDEGLQTDHVVLGGQLQGTVYLAPVVGVVGEQEVVCPQGALKDCEESLQIAQSQTDTGP